MHHVSHQGQQFGPYSVEQINQYLAQGVLDSSSQAWDQDTNGWVEIGQLPGVVFPSQQAPTPVVPVTPEQEVVAEQETEVPLSKSEEKKAAAKKLKMVKIVLGFLIAGGLIYFVTIPFVGTVLEENKKPNKDQVRLVMRALVAFISFCWALVCVTYPFRKEGKKKKKQVWAL